MAKITHNSTVKEIKANYRERVRFSEKNRGVLCRRFDTIPFVQMAGEFTKTNANLLAEKCRRAGFLARLDVDSAGGYWVYLRLPNWK